MSVEIGDIAVSGISKVCFKMKVIEMTVIDASSLFTHSKKAKNGELFDFNGMCLHLLMAYSDVSDTSDSDTKSLCIPTGANRVAGG